MLVLPMILSFENKEFERQNRIKLPQRQSILCAWP